MVRSIKNPKKAKRKNKSTRNGDGSSSSTSVPSMPVKVWQPGVDKLEEGEELQCDPSAYNSLHAFHIGWPCLSFDIVRDTLGLVRTEFPHTLYFVAGTQILKNVDWPEQFPFRDEDFQRFDETPDSMFYESPRFVTHIDDPAIAAQTKFYSKVFPPSNSPGVSILDMCSSWVSHFPAGYKQGRVVGLGMNEEELKRNPVLSEYAVQDLNVNPKLPFEDYSFDVITNVVSVDYLTKPLDVFKEMCRILKPGGLAVMSFSNRCFFTKAISIWTSTGDADHVMIVGAYFHYSGGFEPPQAVDISPNPGRSDPMYVVYSRKISTA